MLEVLLDSGWGPQVKKVLFVCPSLLQKHSYLYLFILFISFKSTNTYICLSQSLTKAHISIFVSPGLSPKHTYLYLLVLISRQSTLIYIQTNQTDLAVTHATLTQTNSLSIKPKYLCMSQSLIKAFYIYIVYPSLSLKHKYLCPSLSPKHTYLYLYAPVSHQSTHIYFC